MDSAQAGTVTLRVFSSIVLPAQLRIVHFKSPTNGRSHRLPSVATNWSLPSLFAQIGNQGHQSPWGTRGVNPQIDQLQIARITFVIAVDGEAGDPQRSVQFAVVLAAEPAPTFARGRG